MHKCYVSYSEHPWFRVNVWGEDGDQDVVGRLERTVRQEGHEIGLAVDEGGEQFLAVLVRDPLPTVELERLIRQARLSGSFERLL